MPRYLYLCEACQKPLEIVHPYKEVVEGCSLCGARQSLRKVVSPINIYKCRGPSGSPKVGDTVNETIIDAKKALKKDRVQLKNRKLQ